jgi:CMP-N-acetylneuraminic acid synthetase
MSEELNKEQESKKKIVRKKEIIDEVTSSNEVIEQYQHVPVENEKLIIDKPSVPLFREERINYCVPPVPSKTNKELYESYIKESKKFVLTINSEVIYDSTIDKTGEMPLKFENEFFILYGKKYSYNGLRIKKINKR